MFPPKTIIAIVASLAFHSLARAEVSPVTVRVEQDSKNSADKESKTVTRTLKVHVTNSSAEPQEARVKYVYFGRSLAERDIVSIGEGEKPVSLKPRATEVVEATSASATMKEKSFKDKKKTEASGTKFVGYGVQVFVGEKMVAETYNPPSLQESWGKTTPPTKK